MLKIAKANYGIEAGARSMGEISKFSNFMKCNAAKVEIEGQIVCRNQLPVKVEKNDTNFSQVLVITKLNLKLKILIITDKCF